MKYIKLHLGEPHDDKEMFVREDDYKEMQKALKGKNSSRIVKATITMLAGSPDGLNDLSEAIHVWSVIHKLKDVKQLKNFRDLINYEIKKINNKEKIKKKNGKRKIKLH